MVCVRDDGRAVEGRTRVERSAGSLDRFELLRTDNELSLLNINGGMVDEELEDDELALTGSLLSPGLMIGAYAAKFEGTMLDELLIDDVMGGRLGATMGLALFLLPIGFALP